MEDVGDAQRRRLRHLQRARRERACSTRAGRTASIRSSTPTAASRTGRSRWSRCRATCSPPIKGLAALAEPARRGRRRRRTGPSSPRRLRDAVEAAVLDGGPRLLRARASTATASSARCAPPMPGICSMSACRRAERAQMRRRRSCCRRHFYSGWGVRTLADDEAAVQPDVLPQRLDLAARHGDLRGRPGALRRARQRGEADERHVRGGGALQHAPAGAVLRLPARAPARRRSPIPSPACRRPGRPGRCSC